MVDYRNPNNKPYDSTSAGILAGQYGLGLFGNWDTMSPYQKALYLAHFGINTYNLANGDYNQGGIYGQTIPGTDGSNSPGLSIGDGLTLAGGGLNLANAVQNWNSVDAIGRALYGGQTIKNAADAYDIFNKYMASDPGKNTAPLNSYGAYGALSGSLSAVSLYQLANNWGKMSSQGKVIGGVSGVANTKSLYDITSAAMKSGTTSVAGQAAAEGTGQIAAQAGSQVAAQGGTQVAAQAGGQVATEAAADWSANIIPGAQVITGAYGMVQGGKMAAKNWGTGGAEGRAQGAMAGATAGLGAAGLGAGLAYMTGLAALGPAGWIVGGVLFAASMLGGSIKTGKSTAQGQRDSIRNIVKGTNGMADDQYNITLTNGSKQNIGLDGHSPLRDPTNPSQLHGGGVNGKLQAFDVDYTNDLDYFAGTGGITLSRILSGGDGQGHMDAIDQVGGQLGNAILSGTTGFGKEFTKDNFNAVKTELLGQYAKAGIKTKDDAFAIINELAKQKRITSDQQISMNQMANMIYDKNGYDLASKLYANRQQATAVAADKANGTNTSGTTQVTKPAVSATPSEPANAPTVTPSTPAAKTPAAPTTPEAAGAAVAGVATPTTPARSGPVKVNNAEAAKALAAAANAAKYPLQTSGAQR